MYKCMSNWNIWHILIDSTKDMGEAVCFCDRLLGTHFMKIRFIRKMN